MISTIVTIHAGTAALGAATAVGLAVVLVISELAGTGESESLQFLRRSATVFAGPLLLVFAYNVIMTCLRIL